MDAIASALASQQAAYQDQMSLVAVKMAAQSQQQLANMLAQAAQSGAALASNPPNLGQTIDTYA